MRKAKVMCIIVSIFLIVSNVFVLTMVSHEDASFDPVEWKQAALFVGGPSWGIAGADVRRVQMLNAVLDKIKVGASKAGVDKLLGEADEGTDGMCRYYLTQRPGLYQQLVSQVKWGTRDPALELHFNSNSPSGVLSSVQIR